MADRVSLRTLGLFVCLLGTSLCAMATPPQRIVSLTPHLTELLFDIGAGDRVVATDDASDFPPEVAPLPRVANYRSINLEALLAHERGILTGLDDSERATLVDLLRRVLGTVEAS